LKYTDTWNNTPLLLKKTIVKNKLYSEVGDVFSTYTIIMNNIYLFKDAEVFNEEEEQFEGFLNQK